MQTSPIRSRTTARRVIANVNDDAFRQLKVCFAINDETMQEAVIKALIQYYHLQLTYQQVIEGLTTRQNEIEEEG